MRGHLYRPAVLYNNALAIVGAYLFFAWWAIGITGFVVVYLVKSRKVKELFPEYFTSIRGISFAVAAITALMFLGSIVTLTFVASTLCTPECMPVEFRRILKIRVTPLDLETFLRSIAAFATCLWLGLVGAFFVEKRQQSSGSQFPARAVGSLITGAAFLPWPLFFPFKTPNINIETIVDALSKHAVQSAKWPFAAISYVSKGTAEHWYFPLQYIYGLIALHGGNQFALAHYYPSVLAIVGIGGFAGWIFRGFQES
jgi:hypothetical protein